MATIGWLHFYVGRLIARVFINIYMCITFFNVCFLSTESYLLYVPENHRLNENIGTLVLEDKDQIQNKEPTFSIQSGFSEIFNVELNPNKDGNLVLKKVGRLEICLCMRKHIG